MQDKTVRQLYALVHRTEDAGTAEHASLHAAAALARQSNAHVHALLVVNGNDAGPAIEEAKSAGAHAITLLECPASVSQQPQQLAASFIALIASPPGAGKNALYLVSAGTRVEEMAGAIAAHFDALPLGRPAPTRWGKCWDNRWWWKTKAARADPSAPKPSHARRPMAIRSACPRHRALPSIPPAPDRFL